jgi:hypothetical protein
LAGWVAGRGQRDWPDWPEHWPDDLSISGRIDRIDGRIGVDGGSGRVCVCAGNSRACDTHPAPFVWRCPAACVDKWRIDVRIVARISALTMLYLCSLPGKGMLHRLAVFYSSSGLCYSV